MNNYGILTAISWNSNKWSDKATKEDIENATMGWVMENARMYEDINFGHELYPTEADGSYIGYTPKFNLSNFPTVENTRYVDFVFFTSVDYKTKVNSIVGFYAYPEIGRFEHNTDHPYYKDYTWGM